MTDGICNCRISIHLHLVQVILARIAVDKIFQEPIGVYSTIRAILLSAFRLLQYHKCKSNKRL